MYLQWHHGAWRVRLVVPARLLEKIGKRVLTATTGADDYERAVRLARPIVARFKALIAKADGTSRRVHLKHVRAETTSSEWFTPEVVFRSMPGVEFDLDVASPGATTVPWIPAKRHLTKADDGLRQPWRGFVWMNCPFGLKNGMSAWLQKFVEHGDGLAYLAGNFYTKWWQGLAARCDAILYVNRYLNAVSPSGRRSRASFGTSLFAIGDKAVAALRLAECNGLGYVMYPARAAA
jgi:hypothetical protein